MDKVWIRYIDHWILKNCDTNWIWKHVWHKFSWTYRSHNNSCYTFEIYARNCTGNNKIIHLGETVLVISILKKWLLWDFAKCLRRVGSQNPRYLRKYFKCWRKTLNLSIKYILQHVVKISANLEMVEREALVELS